MSHTAARRVKVVADGLSAVHGETDERPIPDPRATRSKVRATAAKAPPMIAAQETADCEPEISSATTAARPPVSATSAIARISLMPEEHKQDNDRDRYAEQPEKDGHLSFLHVLVIDPAIENSCGVAQQLRLSRRRSQLATHGVLYSRNTVAR